MRTRVPGGRVAAWKGRSARNSGQVGMIHVWNTNRHSVRKDGLFDKLLRANVYSWLGNVGRGNREEMRHTTGFQKMRSETKRVDGTPALCAPRRRTIPKGIVRQTEPKFRSISCVSMNDDIGDIMRQEVYMRDAGIGRAAGGNHL